MAIEIGTVTGKIKLIDNFTSELGRVASQLEKQGKKIKKVGEEMSDVGGKLTASLTLPILALGGIATKFASDFESSFAGVRKTVNATEAEFAALSAGMRELATEIPVNVDELNRIGEAAGQLGIKTEAIMGFTRVVADLGVTTNLSADAAATSLARLANITGLPQEQFDRLGSTIVALGNTFATTEAEIVEFGLRMAGAGTIAGLTEAEILGIGAALSSVGVEAEAGGTAVQKVLLGITQAVAQGNADLAIYASTAGLSAQQFADAWKKDAGGAFTAFVEGLGKQGEAAFATLEQLNLQDQRLIRSFLSLAGAGDLLSRTLTEGNTAFAENVALAREAEQRYNTFRSKLTVFLNELKDVAITLGSALLPVFRDMLTAARPVVSLLASAAEAFARLPKPVQFAAVALAGLVAAAGPVLFIAGQLVTSYGAVIATFPKVAAVFAVASKGIAASAAVLTGPAGWIAAGAALLLLIKPIREAVLDLGGRAMTALRGGVSAVIGKFREWWKASAEMRQALGLVARQLVADLGTALRAVAGALQVAWNWMVKAARAMADVFVRGMEMLGVLKALALAWDAVAEATKRAAGWLERVTGLADAEGIGKLLVVLRMINPAFAQAAAGAGAYGARAARLQAQQEAMVKVASEVVSETENIVLTTAEMDRAFSQAAEGGVKELSEEAKALADRWRLAAAQSEQLVAAINEGGRPAFEALQRRIEAVNEVMAAGEDPASALGRELVALGVAAAAADKKLEIALGRLENAELRRVADEMRAIREEFFAIAETREIDLSLPEIEPPVIELEVVIPDQPAALKKLDELAENYAKRIEAVQQQAWSNVQDIAADAISSILREGEVDFKKLADSILDIFANMLAELLVTWAVNAAKRIALERAVAAAGGASSSATGAATNAATGAATTAATTGATSGSFMAAYGSSLAALWPIAVAAAVIIAFDWYSSRQRDKRFGQAREFEIRDGQATSMPGQFKALSDEWQRIIKGIEEVTGGIVKDLPKIGIQVRRDGEAFRVFIADQLLGTFKTIEEASQAALLAALDGADWGGTLSVFMEGVIDSFQQTMTAEVMAANLEFARMIEDLGKTDFELQVSQIGRGIDAMFERLEEVINTGVAENLEALGFGLNQVVDEELRRWEAAWRQVTGIELSPEEQLEMMRAQAMVFEAELALRILDLKARRDQLEAERALTIGRVDIGNREIQIQRDLLGARAELMGAEMTITRTFIGAQATVLDAAMTALDLQIQAINNLIAGLEAIPTIDLSRIRLPGGGGSGIDQAANDMERLADLLEQSARLGLSDYQQAVAAINDKWDDAIPLAHGNAEELARINEARQREIDLLREQQLMDFTAQWQDFLDAANGGLGGSAFLDAMQSIDDQVADLGANLGQLATDLGLSGHALLYFWSQVLAGADAMREAAARQGFLDLARGLADLTQNEDLRHRLLMQVAEIEFDLRMAQYEAEMDMLLALGYLTQAQADLLNETLADVAANRDLIIRAQVPVRGGGGGGPDPADERARALERLRDIQARSLDPFSQAIRSVVDEFAELRRVLGWTAEVQAAYAQEIRRVLMEQLEPIRRLQEELAFRSDSPMRSIDQFRLAQTQLNDAVAALRAGDLSALESIPDLARLVLDLNPNSQASEASRFLFEMINRILEEAAQAAEDAVSGIVPGSATDPWTALRDTPTAGDELIARTIREIGDVLDRGLDDVGVSIDDGTGGIQDRLPEPAFDWGLVGARPPGGGENDEGPRRITAESRDIEMLQRTREIAASNARIVEILGSDAAGVRAAG